MPYNVSMGRISSDEARERMQAAYALAVRYESEAGEFASEYFGFQIRTRFKPGPELLRFLNLRALEIRTKVPLPVILQYLFDSNRRQIQAIRSETGKVAVPWRSLLSQRAVLRLVEILETEFPDALQSWKAAQKLKVVHREMEEFRPVTDPFEISPAYLRRNLRLRRILREEADAHRHPYRDNPWRD